MPLSFLKAFSYLFTGLIFHLSLPAIGQYKQLVNKTYAERYLAIDSLFFNSRLKHDDSVTAFREINKLAKLAKEAGDEELLLEAEMLRLVYYIIGKQQNHKLFEPGMLKLRAVADQKEIPQLQVRTRQMLSFYYLNINQQLGPAYANYLDSYYLLQHIPASELPNKQELVATIGEVYLKAGEDVKARKYILEALSLPPSYKKSLQTNLLNSVGISYRNEEKLDSAEIFFRKALATARSEHDSTWLGIVSGNLAHVLVKQEKNAEAIRLLELDVQESLKAGEKVSAVLALLMLADIYLAENNLPKTEQIIKQISEHVNAVRIYHSVMFRYYKIMAAYNEKSMQPSIAYRYADSAVVASDSVAKQKSAMQLMRAEQNLEIKKYLDEIKTLESVEKENTTKRKGLAILAIFLTVIAAGFIWRQRRKHKQQQELLRKQREAAEAKTHAAEAQIKAYIEQIQLANEKKIYQSHQVQTGESSQSPPLSETPKSKTLNLTNVTTLTDEQWDKFLILFEDAHPGFLNRLREKFPEVSPAERRFIILSRLALSNKEMANILNITPDALRQTRHRLRKKLGISDEKVLTDLINSI